MADVDTVLASVLGGAIAGGVGLAATLYERHLVRRERHLAEHKANLAVIEESLLNLRVRIWPPSRDPENFNIAEGYKVDAKLTWEGYSLVNYQYTVLAEEGRYRTIFIDDTLFADLSVHFPELHRNLEKIDRAARGYGPRINQHMYDLFDAIYSAMRKRTMAPLYPGAENDSLNRRDLANATFNMLIGTDVKEWRSRHSQLFALHALADVEKLAKELRESLAASVDEMVRLRDQAVAEIDQCLKTIDDIRHKQGLKGRCPYS